MSNVQHFRLPDNASSLDRATLAVWRVWDGWLYATTGGAARTVVRLLGGATAVFVVVENIAGGPWAIAGAVALVGGAAAGWIIAGKGSAAGTKPAPQRPAVRIVSFALGFLPALLLVPLAFITATVLSGLLIVPVANYKWPVVLLLASSIAAGWLLRRRRIQVESRYP